MTWRYAWPGFSHPRPEVGQSCGVTLTTVIADAATPVFRARSCFALTTATSASGGQVAATGGVSAGVAGIPIGEALAGGVPGTGVLVPGASPPPQLTSTIPATNAAIPIRTRFTKHPYPSSVVRRPSSASRRNVHRHLVDHDRQAVRAARVRQAGP